MSTLRQVWSARPTRVLVGVIKWTCAWAVFTEYVVQPRPTSGASMLPTLGWEPELVLTSSLPYFRRPPGLQRGDMIVAYSPLDRGKEICKRVIGLPGDTVCTDPSGIMRPTGEHIVVPKGHVWIAGDNMGASTDSRVFGPVPLALIRGRVLARVYPSPQIFRNPVKFFDE